MTLVAMRLLAIIGGPAHLVALGARQALWFVRLRLPWALLAAAALALGGWASFTAAQRAEAQRPSPLPTSVGQLVDSGRSGWMTLQAVVDGPVWDSSAYGAGVLRHYYVLSDPDDASVALLARSPERLEERRTRTIRARVVPEPPPGGTPPTDLVSSAFADRYLVEVGTGQPPGRAGQLGGIPELPAGGEGEVTIRGTFTPLGSAPCEPDQEACADGTTYRYLASEGQAGVVVESPFPPDALPVELSGVPTSDALRVEQARAEPAVAAAIGERSTPATVLFAEGVTPPFIEVSYLPAAALAILAAVLLLGWLLGYPIWEMRMPRERAAAAPLGRGLATDVGLNGWLSGPDGRISVDDTPAVVERLAPDELERRSWQYSQVGGSLLAHPAAASEQSARLVLHSGHGPLLLGLEPPPSELSLTVGRLHRLTTTRPALRLRGKDLDLVATAESAADLLRVLAEIDPAWRSRVGRVVAEGGAAAPPPATPRQLPVAVAVFGALGGALATIGLLGLGAGLVTGDLVALPGPLALTGLGTLLIMLAVGLQHRRDWARSIGINVGWIGALVAVFLSWAAAGCFSWLSPGPSGCRPAGLVGTLAAVVVAAGLAYAAWVLRRSSQAFDR